jgi:hypothetical protein
MNKKPGKQEGKGNDLGSQNARKAEGRDLERNP